MASTQLLLFEWDDIPPACISHNVNDMIKGKFYQKLKVIACQQKQLKPYTPWSNAAEGEIKELEKGAGCKLLQSRASKCLWDDCLELEAYIRSNTTYDTYKIDDRYPKK